jgi:putative component of toxin-antitoxin plasmid stabilization module
MHAEIFTLWIESIKDKSLRSKLEEEILKRVSEGSL